MSSTTQFGSRRNAVSPTYPEASVQNLTGPWWETSVGGNLTRGRLVRAIVPYPDMKPYRLVPEGRGEDSRQHTQANYRIEEFRTGEPTPGVSPLPVAGLPLRSGETYLVRRGKTRPAVVVALPGSHIAEHLRRTGASWQHRPTALLAPFYGIEADGTRGGWNPEFVGRIQRAEYSQYVWDLLPVGGSESGSILRLDHLFPIGFDPSNWTPTEYRLRDDALRFLDEWVSWHVTGKLTVDGLLAFTRAELSKI